MKRDVERDFQALQRAHPELAKELLIRAELANGDFELKSTYIKGALFVYSLLVFNSQTAMLEELFKTTFSGDGAGEVPPLST